TTPQTAGAADDYHPITRYAFLVCFVACFGGWTLNAMEVVIFHPAMKGITENLDVRKADVVLVGTATLLTSAFGGWLAGAVSDRVGRVFILRFMIAWFTVFTCLCGLARSYDWLFVLRALMGIGFGGQWAAAAVMLGETCDRYDKARRGWWVGFMQSGWALGWAIAEGMPQLLPPILNKLSPTLP